MLLVKVNMPMLSSSSPSKGKNVRQLRKKNVHELSIVHSLVVYKVALHELQESECKVSLDIQLALGSLTPSLGISVCASTSTKTTLC